MHGFEVHTAVEERLPVIWIVLNDGGHGMVRHGDTLMHGAPLGVSDFRVMIDVAATGKAMGASSARVNNPRELRAALATAFQEKGPTVIDARIDPTEMAPSLIRRVKTLSKMFASGQARPRSPIGE
jgi:acetolactate synthase-1/2/3 large subunit